MAIKGKRKDAKGAVIVKRYTIEEGGHHGGAWKVAYADFVTAMMAFFLLMWLLSATTEEQRKGLADYFSPTNILSHNNSGSGQPFGGHTPFDQGALVSDRGSASPTVGNRPVVENAEDGNDPLVTEVHRAKPGEGGGDGPMTVDQNADDETDQKTVGQPGTPLPPGPGGNVDSAGQGNRALNRESPADKAADRDRENAAKQRAQQEKAAFETAAEQIKEAVRDDPTLAELSKQLAVDMTPDGLRIQIMDEVKLPMFQTGSATPNERARLLLQKVVPVLMKLSHPISIAGHTDGQAFPGHDRTNWELSTERANMTRRLLTDEGFPDGRIRSVTGHADRDPLLPADPLAAANRRIAILVLREAPVPPAAGRPVDRAPPASR